MITIDSAVAATTPQEALVVDFFDGMGPDLDAFRETYRRLLAEDVVWETVGRPPRIGRPACLEYLETLRDRTGMEYCDVELLTMVSSGDTVITERVDTMKRADGTTVIAFRIVGVTVLDAGRIVRYTDYCDLSPMG